MNDNPIICDFEEIGAKDFEQKYDFSNSYNALKYNDYSLISEGYLKWMELKKETKEKPFYCEDTKEFYMFIRKVKKTVVEILQQILKDHDLTNEEQQGLYESIKILKNQNL